MHMSICIYVLYICIDIHIDHGICHTLTIYQQCVPLQKKKWDSWFIHLRIANLTKTRLVEMDILSNGYVCVFNYVSTTYEPYIHPISTIYQPYINHISTIYSPHISTVYHLPKTCTIPKRCRSFFGRVRAAVGARSPVAARSCGPDRC